MVNIKNTSDALTFVRLRTSLSTYGYWPGEWTVEVVKTSDKMPEFSSWDGSFGGPVGVLTDRDFTSLGFCQASVENIDGKFVITRWLLLCSPSNGYHNYVEKVREDVGPDGDYTMTVLKQEDVSNSLLDGPNWAAWSSFPEPM